MKIIGANICLRPSGRKLRDAGACLINDGELIVAIAEERITRRKHDGTIHNSIYYCLEASGNTIDNIDFFVFSMCAAKTPTVRYVYNYLLKNGIEIPKDKIIICPSHHLAHAASAFFASGYDDSLIVVADRDGSIREGNERLIFANSVEHLSYYVGHDNEIELVDQDEIMVGDLGLGQGYSYVTEWLGFDGHSMAGKTMALAAYGESGALEPAHFFTFEDNRIKGMLEPIASHKSLAVRRLILKNTGKDIGGKCKDCNSQDAYDVARLVQDDLENVMLQKLGYLQEKTGQKNLCFAGGVALNCKLNYEIYKSGMFDNIFVQPAAGDTGQCLGNALYGYHMVNKQKRTYIMRHAYYGKEYDEDAVRECIDCYRSQIEVRRPKDIYGYMAQRLLEEKIVAWFQGKSEFGPRALGNRSILASPIPENMRDWLNENIKYREWFRPYGVCIMEDEATRFFDIAIQSPYMLYAPKVLDMTKERIPSAVHVDSSSRIQTVNRKTNERLYNLLTAFKDVTGVPMLINTSFNLNGQPIVESPKDAMECFLKSNIDYLVLFDNVISKNL